MTIGNTSFYTLGDRYKILGYNRFFHQLNIKDDKNIRLRFLLMALGTEGGVGRNLWKVPASELRCPTIPGIERFIRIWFPEYRSLHDIDHAISLFGFERDCDFYYAMKGWEAMSEKKPKAYNRLATIFGNWYANGYRRCPCHWELIEPPIDL